MEMILNKVALRMFDFIAARKGYTFKRVRTLKDFEQADAIYTSEGFDFPEELLADVQKYKLGTINFLAYYKGEPAGVVRMADPSVINRAWEHYGVDREGRHHEIQSLVVRKEFRDGAQFVMLGLVKQLYVYSMGKNIRSWSACGKHNVYLTMRRYCADTRVIDIDFGAIDHPVTRFLHTNKIVETYFTMGVASFSPWNILKRCVKRLVRAWKAPRLPRLGFSMPEKKNYSIQ